MTLTFRLDLNGVRVHKKEEFLAQKSFRSKNIVHIYRHTTDPTNTPNGVLYRVGH